MSEQIPINFEKESAKKIATVEEMVAFLLASDPEKYKKWGRDGLHEYARVLLSEQGKPSSGEHDHFLD